MVKVDTRAALALGVSTGSGYALYRITSSKLIGCLTGIGVLFGWVAWNAYPTVRFRRKSIATLRELVDTIMEHEFELDMEDDEEALLDVDSKSKKKQRFIQKQRRADQVSKLADLRYGIALNVLLA